MPSFFGLGFGQAPAADLRFAIRAPGNVVLVNRLGGFSANRRDGSIGGNPADMRELGQSGTDVTNGIHAFLSSLHPLVYVDKAAFRLDVGRFLQTNFFRIGAAAHGDQHFLGVEFFFFAFGGGECHRYAIFGLLDFVTLRALVEGDGFVLKDPQQFHGDILILHRDQPRQGFKERDLTSERVVNGCELHSHRAATDDDHGFGDRRQTQHFNIGEDFGIGLQSGQHAGVGAGGKNHVLGLDLRRVLAVRRDAYGVHAAFGWPSQASEAEHAVYLVLAYQKVQALGVLGDNLVLTVLDVLPVQLACAQAVNAVLFGIFHVVINFRIEQQCLGGNAAHLQACAAELFFLVDQAGLQPKLAGAEGGSISAGSTANDGKVMRGYGYGVIGDIVLGILGAIVGSWLFRFFGIGIRGGFLMAILVATCGAVVLVAIARLLKK